MGILEDLSARLDRAEARIAELEARQPSESPTVDRHEAAELVGSKYGTVSKAENRHLLPPPVDGRSTYARAHVIYWAGLTVAERASLYLALAEGRTTMRAVMSGEPWEPGRIAG